MRRLTYFILPCYLFLYSGYIMGADLRGQLIGLSGAKIEVRCGDLQRSTTIAASNRFHITDLPANQSCFFKVSLGQAVSVRTPFHTRQNITDFNGSMRKIGNRIIVVRR